MLSNSLSFTAILLLIDYLHVNTGHLSIERTAEMQIYGQYAVKVLRNDVIWLHPKIDDFQFPAT